MKVKMIKEIIKNFYIWKYNNGNLYCKKCGFSIHEVIKNNLLHIVTEKKCIIKNK